MNTTKGSRIELDLVELFAQINMKFIITAFGDEFVLTPPEVTKTPESSIKSIVYAIKREKRLNELCLKKDDEGWKLISEIVEEMNKMDIKRIQKDIKVG